ncbi:hydroxyarylamine O-acetyltransferase [Seminavis robusta]|uniref:Hydroxyarylamine O-acetyltransferase n=1 Tax=Seminavis robusta TaxID=568900 RepID=A0A9N8DJL1_9STRA|nr:hydroxyarylamine O-acetyltransferase [Seminavis robusta]|eukprot:Sro119_g058200.1 hydroxyarylamine O-acetyltransferase (288) ;mRNA; f:87957-88820
MLADKYFQRLGFTPEQAKVISSKHCKDHLDQIVEANLRKITFDNLSQHGLPLTASIDVHQTATKILDHGRGGFCFELNGLLAAFLEELGYTVQRLPAIVHSDERKFNHPPSHVILVVSTTSDPDEKWFADVGFGEPAIHSLRYELDTEQTTPEGMTSRIVQDEGNVVNLEWKKDGEWLPRLKWDFEHPGQPLEAFQSGLDIVLDESSIFHKKLIVCRIDRNEKVSLAGSRLKRTSPRFGPDATVTVQDLETTEAAQKALKEVFRVPNPQDLDLERSKQAAPKVWSTM